MNFTCDFVRHECSHAELFRANYQRTNRTKRSKILRCFPHCCPDHVTRSFCGAPLYLDVHCETPHPTSANDANGATNATYANFNNANYFNDPNYSNAPRASDERSIPLLFVFARFRLQQEAGFRVGTVLSPDAIAQSMQNDDHPNGEWIKSTIVQRPPTANDPQPWRFKINSSARWFYGWESGVAKSHRLREHVLDVIVTMPARDDATATECLRVVASTQSPPFKMISFRRATPEALTLLSTSSAPTVPLPPADDDAVLHQMETNILRPPSVVARPLVRPKENLLASQLLDLVVVWTFIQKMPLRSVLPLTPTMESVFWHQLMATTPTTPTKPATAGSNIHHPRPPAPPVDTTLAALLHLADGGRDDPQSSPPLTPLLHITAHIALWFCWDPVLDTQWRHFLDDAALVLLDGSGLRRRFENGVVRWFWTQLDAWLTRVDWTLATLVEAIQRSDPGSHLTKSADAMARAYESFVAHVRERFIDHERSTTNAKRRRLGMGPTGPSVFDGEWVATLDDLQLDGVQGKNDTSTPWRLVQLLWFWREFSALALTLDVATSTLCVRSLVRHDQMNSSQMAFVLDHGCRWTRHLPSGDSTLAVSLAGWSVGDYVGKLSPSGQDIHLNCYAWPSHPASGDSGFSNFAGSSSDGEDNDGLYATCFQLHFHAGASVVDPLHVRVTVNRGWIDPRPLGLGVRASPASVPAEIQSLSLRQRLALVPQWQPSGEWLAQYHRIK